MADVMASFDGESDRGQLLLVTALTLAVMLVTVALLLNTAIFTENVATRDTTADGSEAIELRGEAVDAVGGVIETENRVGSGDPDNVEAAVDAMGPLVDRERARHGTVATLRVNESAPTTPGSLLRWNESGGPRAFDDHGSNWTFVDDLDNARGVRVEIDPSTLNATNAASSDDDAMGVRFINDTSDNVTFYLYEDGSTLSIAEAVDGGTPTRQCSIEHNGTTAVDFTASQLSTNGSATDCFRGLWPPDSPDEIEFVNVGDEEGTAEATVESGTTPIGDVDDDSAVYAATVDITYQSQDLTFETTVRVAPGEPR